MSIHSSTTGSADRVICRLRRMDRARCRALSSGLVMAAGPEPYRTGGSGGRRELAGRGLRRVFALAADARQEHDEVARAVAVVELRQEDLLHAEAHAAGRAGEEEDVGVLAERGLGAALDGGGADLGV